MKLCKFRKCIFCRGAGFYLRVCPFEGAAARRGILVLVRRRSFIVLRLINRAFAAERGRAVLSGLILMRGAGMIADNTWLENLLVRRGGACRASGAVFSWKSSFLVY